MQSLTQPELLLKPFAENGDKNTIPVTNTDSENPQLADLTGGFPPITSLEPGDGGLPPERKDFNALGFLTTSYDFFYQAGGTFTFSSTISNAIGGYPLGARLWYTDANGVSMIVRSTIENNTNNFISNPSYIGEVGESKPWVVENFRGIKTQYGLFDFKWQDYETTDMNWLRADTFSWNDGMVYSNAYNHLANDISGKTSTTETINGTTVTYYLADDGHKIVDVANASAVETIYSSTGVAWYYILDTTNQRFKLPRTKYGFTGLRDAVGKYVEPGLPDHNHSFSFKADTSHLCDNGTSWRPVAVSQTTLTTNASASNSIYGNSTTVQPPATQMYLYFYVGNFSQSATEQTAGLNSELFNGKLDIDLGNLPSVGKSYLAGIGMPSDTYEDMASTSYTAPANGYAFFQAASGTNNGYVNIVVNENLDGYRQVQTRNPVGTQVAMLVMPCKKGDSVICGRQSNGSINYNRFIYAEGEV